MATIDEKAINVGGLNAFKENVLDADYAPHSLVTALNTERDRAMTAENNLQTLYNNLQQSKPVPVTTLPATGEAGKIYRLAGTTSYADYMWDGSQFIKMAEYNNAIDDEPTAGSDNLVTSGGVFNSVTIDGDEESSTQYDKTNLVNPGLIKDDYSINSALTGYGISDFIELPENASKIVYKQIWDTAQASVYLGLTLYTSNSMDSYIPIPANSYNGELDLADYPTAKYVRFCGITSNNENPRIEIYVYNFVTIKDAVVNLLDLRDEFIIVDINEKGHYTSLRSAIDNAGDGINTHKTIIVYPGTYIMPPYENYTAMSNRNISIIGVDRDSCIIKSTGGYYQPNQKDCACIKMQGDVLLKNLTFISTNDDSSVSESDANSYCIHINGNHNNGTSFIIENCVLENNHNICVGADLYNCNLIMRNCIAKTSNIVNPQSHHMGTIFCHGKSSGGSWASIILDNCRLENTLYRNAIQFAPLSGPLDVTLWYNILKTNGEQNTSTNYIGTLNSLSYGNNVAALNP